jgi:hypothetical protein
LFAFCDVVAIDGPAPPRYPSPWSETPATSFPLTREATLGAIGECGFVIQARRMCRGKRSAGFSKPLPPRRTAGAGDMRSKAERVTTSAKCPWRINCSSSALKLREPTRFRLKIRFSYFPASPKGVPSGWDGRQLQGEGRAAAGACQLNAAAMRTSDLRNDRQP